MRVHCLFEQSGTFKNEFKKLGVPAEDYDILNDFGETDHIIDLFKEIRGGYNGEPSIFDTFSKDDLIMAFFPCVSFEARMPLNIRGEASQAKGWTDTQKLKYGMKLHNEVHEMYLLISKMAVIAIEKGLRMIIENPYTQPHYLTTHWCLKPALVDTNRKRRGDYYAKPTQYWFINCEPKHNFIFEPQIVHSEWETVERASRNARKTGKSRQVARSMICPDYANRFIREFILEEN